MSIAHLRRIPRLHSLVWAVLLCFALGTLAQAGHIHTAHSTHTHEQCELCVSFGGLMAAPSATPPAATTAPTDSLIVHHDDVSVSARISGLPQARAPPLC